MTAAAAAPAATALPAPGRLRSGDARAARQLSGIAGSTPPGVEPGLGAPSGASAIGDSAGARPPPPPMRRGADAAARAGRGQRRGAGQGLPAGPRSRLGLGESLAARGRGRRPAPRAAGAPLPGSGREPRRSAAPPSVAAACGDSERPPGEPWRLLALLALPIASSAHAEALQSGYVLVTNCNQLPRGPHAT